MMTGLRLFLAVDAAICLSAGGGWAWLALGCCVMGLALREEETA